MSFNGHPPLGVNATCWNDYDVSVSLTFQWAPTLGGECYNIVSLELVEFCMAFQWAPTLGGECYLEPENGMIAMAAVSMGTHPWG